jgi:hypothetical protein
MPKPSFLSSTLGLAFLLIIVSIIAMIFLRVEANPELLTILSSVVSFYIGQRKGQSDAKSEILSKTPEKKNLPII